MTNRRAKIAAGATAVGLAALGGADTGARHQVRPPIVTRASGSGAGSNFAEED